MFISKLLSIVRSHGWLLALTTIIASLTTIVVLGQQSTIYEARTQLLVGPGMNSASPDLNSLRIGGQLIQTYAGLVETHPFLESVNNKLTRKMDVGVLEDMIEVRHNVDTRILTIIVHSSNPERAMEIADAATASLLEISPSKENMTDLLRAQMSVQAQGLEQVIASAQMNIQSLEAELTRLKSASPINPQVQQADLDRQNLVINQLEDERTHLSDSLRTLATIYQVLMDNNTNRLEIIQTADTVKTVDQNLPLRTATSGLAGLIFGLIVIFAIEYVSPTIRVAEDLADATGARLLAEIPKYRRTDGTEIESIATYSRARPEAANRYRSIMARLMLDIEESTPQVFTLTDIGIHSAGVAAAAAANLAVAFAQADKRIILVDAHFQKPLLTMHFGAVDKVGLSDHLAANPAKPAFISMKELPGLRFLPIGTNPEMGSNIALNSAKISKFLTELKEEAEIIIVSTSPISETAESLSLASQLGNVILTARSGELLNKTFGNVMSSLDSMNVQVIGAILDHNKTPFGIRQNFLTRSMHTIASGLRMRSKAGKTIGQN